MHTLLTKSRSRWVGSYLVRVDILERTPGRIRQLEVKATGWTNDPDTKAFRGKRGGILSDWPPYLEDVAFQTWGHGAPWRWMSIPTCS